MKFMKSMKWLMMTAMMAFLSIPSSAQPGTNSIAADSTYDTGFDGSFQIICSSRTKEVFTIDILPLIEQLRSDTEVVMYQYSVYSTFRIFPRNIINSPAWVPVTDIYLFPTKEEIMRIEQKRN